MTPYRIRVLSRDVVGRLAVCVALLAFAAGQEPRTPDQEIQFQAMKKFEFLVGKWSGSSLWCTRQGVLNLIATDDVRYEQNGLTLKIYAQERQADGKPIGFSVLRIFYDDKSGIAYAQTQGTQRAPALSELTMIGGACPFSSKCRTGQLWKCCV